MRWRAARERPCVRQSMLGMVAVEGPYTEDENESCSWATHMTLVMCRTGSCGVQATDIATTVSSPGTPHDLCHARRGGRAVSALQKACDAHLARVGRSCWPDELQRVQRTRSGSCGTLLPERRSMTGRHQVHKHLLSMIRSCPWMTSTCPRHAPRPGWLPSSQAASGRLA